VEALKDIYDIKPIKLSTSVWTRELNADLGADAAPLG
jgi:hypothetical protein